jgi:hypothetical protein
MIQHEKPADAGPGLVSKVTSETVGQTCRFAAMRFGNDFRESIEREEAQPRCPFGVSYPERCS